MTHDETLEELRSDIAQMKAQLNRITHLLVGGSLESPTSQGLIQQIRDLEAKMEDSILSRVNMKALVILIVASVLAGAWISKLLPQLNLGA